MPRFRFLAYLILAHVMAFPAMAAEPKLEGELSLENQFSRNHWLEYDPSGKYLGVSRSSDVWSTEIEIIVWDLTSNKQIISKHLGLPSRGDGFQIGSLATFHPSSTHLCLSNWHRDAIHGFPLKEGDKSLLWTQVMRVDSTGGLLKSKKLLHINKEALFQIGVEKTESDTPMLFLDRSLIDQSKLVEYRQIKLENRPYMIQISPDAKAIAYTKTLREKSFDQKGLPSIKIINLDSQKTTTLASKTTIEELRSLRFSPDNKHIAAGSADGYFRQWNRETLKEEICIPLNDFAIFSIAYSENGKFIVCTSGSSRTDNLHLLDGSTGKTLFSKTIPGAWNATLSPDSKKLAVLHHKGIQIYDLAEWIKSLK